MIKQAQEIAAETGARITHTEDVGEVDGVDFVYTDVWVSMGEPTEVWEERIHLLRAYQVNTRLLRMTGNPKVKFMHCLPGFHDRHTKVGEELFQKTGMTALEVTDEVFESGTRSCSTRPRTGCTRSRRSWSPRWVAEHAHRRGLGGQRAAAARQKPDAAVQEANVARAVAALAPLAVDHELVITHGNGPQVGVLAAVGVRSAPDHAVPLRRARRADPGDDRLLASQAMQNALTNRQVAAIINQTLVEPTTRVREPDQVRRRGLHSRRGGRCDGEARAG